MYYYGYDQFIDDIKALKQKVGHYRPDALIAVSRGGLTVGHFIASALGIRRVYSLNSIHYEDQKKLDYVKIYNIPKIANAKNVLVVDEIIDSGESMTAILDELHKMYPDISFKTLTIFQKESARHQADYWLKRADGWIDFFWEKDVL